MMAGQPFPYTSVSLLHLCAYLTWGLPAELISRHPMRRTETKQLNRFVAPLGNARSSAASQHEHVVMLAAPVGRVMLFLDACGRGRYLATAHFCCLRAFRELVQF